MFRARARTIICRLVTLVWAAVIFSFSTEPFSSRASESLLVRALAYVGLTVAPATLHMLNSIGRTLAHLTEYAVFGILLYASFWRADDCLWRPELAVRCIAIAAAYGLTDEFHQIFVLGRGASLLDGALDTLGAALSMCIVYGSWRWSQRNASYGGLS